MAYTISNVYTKLNRNLNFKISKLNSKLKLFKFINLFLFLIKLKFAKNFQLYNNFVYFNTKSKFLFCISYSRLKKFFCNLNKLQKNFFKREQKKKFVKKWLKEKFFFNINYTHIFTDLIIFCYIS